MSEPTHDTPRQSKSDKAQDWSNYWQGRIAQDAGSAMAGVETDAELAALWAGALEHAKGPLLDIACGAGTVLRAAHKLGLAPLHGIDISAQALLALERELPNAATSVADAAELPFADGTMQVVTSQFGIEYADRRAFDEAIRVLAPGGRFTAVCHHAGGAIADEVRGKRDAAQALRDTDFIVRAKAVFSADDARFDAAADAFGPAQDAVLAMARAGDGLAAHLYGGTQQLHQRRANYAASDITAWFDGMGAQIDAFHGRMQSMLDAAMGETEVQGIASRIGADVAPVELGGRMSAWRMDATKTA